MIRNRRLSTSSSPKKIGPNVLLFFIILICAGLGIIGFILFELERPQITLAPDLTFIGGPMQLSFHAQDKRSGIRQISFFLRQDGKEYSLFDRQFQRKAWLSTAGPNEVQESVPLDIRTLDAKEGPADFIAVVRDFSLKPNVTTLQLPITIDTSPPRVRIEHAQTHIRQGGSGIVVYELSEPAQRHGVQLEDLFFPGFPLPGGKQFISYITLPWDRNERPESSWVVAVDQAGNEGRTAFSVHLRKVREKRDRIEISDSFLQRKIPEFQEYYPEMSGTDLEKYLYVNQVIRVQNNERIAAICREDTAEEQLWHDRFLRMPGASMASFADHRTYYYQGKAIDEQVHLGIDIASTARAEIRATNRGRVIFAEYFGIYGKTVIVDHGQGLSSLYSHLSRIDTDLGKMVEKDELLGRSGTSGMAGGDHLHLSLLVNGIFVNPIEWLDQNWINININNIIQ